MIALLKRLWARLTWRVDCAWCRGQIDEPVIPWQRRNVSHGICPLCRSSMSDELAQRAADGLDAGGRP